MNDIRERGTEFGTVITEQLVDGVWVAVPVVENRVAPDEDGMEPDRPRRGRPPKAAA